METNTNKIKIKQSDRQLQYMQFLFQDKGADEYICVFGISKDDSNVSTTKHFKGITTAINYINKIKNHFNVYVSLATTDCEGRATDNLISRNCIALDFDLKDLGAGFNYKDLMQLCNKIGIKFQMLINSGNGFHVYLKTDRTTDISKLVEVNKAICEKLGADHNACKSTQVLRVPDTYNHKNNVKKQVRAIHIYDNPFINNIDKLYQQFVFNTKLEETNLKYVATKNMPPCIVSILEGVHEGERDFCLGRLTKYFQDVQHYSYAKTLAILNEWNGRNNPPMQENKLEYHFKKYWEGNYLLNGCVSDNADIQATISKYCSKYECNKLDKFDVVYENGDELVTYTYKELDKIKYQKRGGARVNGNHLVLVMVLRQNSEGLNYKQLEEELTSTITQKCCMSNKTLIKALNELAELGIIDKIEGNRKTIPTLYKIRDINLVENEYLSINHHAIKRYIDGAIGQVSLRLYIYMKYRLNKRENVVQEEIARDLNIDQTAISKAMKELQRAGYIKVVQDKTHNKYGANIITKWL